MDTEVTVGAVVGRFQVDELHEGHKTLISKALEENYLVSIMLGIGPLPTTARKPLPYETRIQVIRNAFPTKSERISFFPLYDHPDDKVWSKSLDDTIKEYHGSWSVKLYHGQDSFTLVYTGEYPTVEVEHADIGNSGTLHRKFIAENPSHSQEFAKGVIWANLNKFPTVYGVVDVVAWNRLVPNEVCLITKTGRSGLQFPGGFTEISSSSDEDDALKELNEETGLDKNLVTEIQYAGSLNIHDWRYVGEPDIMRSRVFTCIAEGSPIGGDDAETAAWYNWRKLSFEDFNPCHRPIVQLLKDLGL